MSNSSIRTSEMKFISHQDCVNIQNYLHIYIITCNKYPRIQELLTIRISRTCFILETENFTLVEK